MTTVYNKDGIPFDIDAIATDLNNKMDKDGINATCPVVISRTPNEQGGVVEIWSDGYCVQTGTISSGSTNGTITLSQSYATTSYFCYCNPSSEGANFTANITSYPNTASSFTWNSYSNSATTKIWRTEGYIR